MKLLLALVVFLCASFAVAADSVYLVGGGYYLDDTNQTVSPKLGLLGHSKLFSDSLSSDNYLGVGYISQPLDLSGNQPNGYYWEYKLKVTYMADPQWFVTAGAGLILNHQAYSSLDDHFSLLVGYKLK